MTGSRAKARMETEWWEVLPHPILTKIFEYLPTLDVINVAKVCVNWNGIAILLLEKIEIDDSTAYGGSFREYNKDLPGRPAKLCKFVNDLAECTDKIKYIDINVGIIPGKCIEKLLYSQKEIKGLVVRTRKTLAESPHESCINEIVKGIIKHESTLETVNIGISEYFVKFEDLANGLKHKESCFDNLKSVEFLSTTAGSYGNIGLNGKAGPKEKESTKEVFEKMFKKSRIEALNFRPKLPLAPIHYEPEVYWNPDLIKILMEYFDRGAFSNLRKINIDSLNTGGIHWEFSERELETLKRCCPRISHIDSNLTMLQMNEYFNSIYDEKPLMGLLKHYGSQIVCLKSPFMTSNLAKCIHEHCPHLRTIAIFDAYEVKLRDEALMLLSDLCHLKNVEIIIEGTEIKLETILKFLEKVVCNLKNLTIGNREDDQFDPAILHAVSCHGSNLKKLHIYLGFSYSEADFKKVMDGVLAVLQGCQKLRELIIIMDIGDPGGEKVSEETYLSYYKAMAETLIMSQRKLKLACIYLEDFFNTDIYKNQLIDEMPFCRFEFDYSDNMYLL